MPKVLTALSIIGVIAMLWVGGHILLNGTAELGWTAPYGFVHALEEMVHQAAGPLGGFLGWLLNTFFSFIAGVIVGGILVVILHLLPFGKKKHAAEEVVADQPKPTVGE